MKWAKCCIKSKRFLTCNTECMESSAEFYCRFILNLWLRDERTLGTSKRCEKWGTFLDFSWLHVIPWASHIACILQMNNSSEIKNQKFTLKMQSHITSIIPGGSGYARREHDIGSTTEHGEMLHHMRSMKNMKCLADIISPHFQETQTGILGTFKILFTLQYSCYMIIISNQHVLLWI